MIIENREDLLNMPDGNKLIGVLPEWENTKIKITGKNNILYCEPNVKIVNSNIYFNCDNSIVYLSSSKHIYYLSASLNNDCVLFIGKDNYFNGIINIALSEQRHCIIGNGGLYSFGVWIRNADPHLIYDIQSKKRLNNTKSIFIGDHVWIGQSAFLLKGTQIDSGSIIGAMGLVSGKKIPANTSYGGNPCRKIAENIFWEESCVHTWKKQQTEESQLYTNYIKNSENLSVNDYIYEYNINENLDFDKIDEELNIANSANERLEILNKIANNKCKNRFVHKKEWSE